MADDVSWDTTLGPYRMVADRARGPGRARSPRTHARQSSETVGPTGIRAGATMLGLLLVIVLSTPVSAASSPSPVVAFSPGPAPSPIILTSTLVITSADNGKTFSNYRISTTSGSCVEIVEATDVTFRDSDVGPCAGNGVHIAGGSRNNVYDSYIHVENLAPRCCDTRDGVKIDRGSSYGTIQGNVIAYNETNVRVDGSSHDIAVVGNFLLNPRGPFPRGQNFQSDRTSNMTVINNYALSSRDTTKYLYPANQEDSINFYKTDGSLAQGNYVTGGLSRSGCGLISDDGSANNRYLNNILYNTGQCGIGIATGANQLVSGNRILNLDPLGGAGNTALYVWNQYPSACGGVTVSDNIVSGMKTPISCNPDAQACVFSSFWDAGNCGAIVKSHNSFDDGTYPSGGGPAYKILRPLVPYSAPLIPPQPKNCVVKSPYSTQTSMSTCG